MNLYLPLILWAVCGIGAYLISSARHSGSPGGWFLVGVLFGPFGLVGSLFSGPGTGRTGAGQRIFFILLVGLAVLMIGYLAVMMANPI